MTEEAEVHEIVIIKRARGGEEGHHGGVWKIAFADFMTAMMAFFLVMWLISANDKTKAVIARYFNPVQLVDATPQRPGLSNPKAGASPSMGEDKPGGEKTGKDNKATKGQNETETDKKVGDSQTAGKQDEVKLFKDPYAVLAELAAKNSTQADPQPPKTSAEGQKSGAGAVGVKGGEAYRDPFEPIPVVSASTQPSAGGGAPRLGQSSADEIVLGGNSGAATADKETADLQRKMTAVAQEMHASEATGSGPHIEVKRTDEGVLIDLTDGTNFSMFASASAQPAPKMVALMAKLGGMLKNQKGKVVIRGFTDSRPFRSDTYDNWRLSSARAHMAHYMLVRGGLDERRIDSIEGFADHRPKNIKNPEAPENRRIEILLKDTAQ